MAIAACQSGRTRSTPDPVAAHAAWANAPLNPPLAFAEAIPPRTVGVLVLDAHSGAPLDGAVVTLSPSGLQTGSDATGRARLRRAALGQQRLVVRRVGYLLWSDSVTVSDTAGLAIVVQMRRNSAMLDDLAVPGKPP